MVSISVGFACAYMQVRHDMRSFWMFSSWAMIKMMMSRNECDQQISFNSSCGEHECYQMALDKKSGDQSQSYSLSVNQNCLNEVPVYFVCVEIFLLVYQHFDKRSVDSSCWDLNCRCTISCESIQYLWWTDWQSIMPSLANVAKINKFDN